MPTPFSSSRKTWMLVGAGLVVVTAAAIMIGLNRPNAVSNTVSSNSTTRADYAALYQAAWRQDSGQANVVVTATLMVPPLTNLLGQDTSRSSAEEQLWQTASGLTDKEIGIFLTIDSVSGAIPDESIKASGTLTVDRTDLAVRAWHPFIAPSHVVNTNQSTTAQSGLLVFSSSQPIDWSTISQLTLVIHGLDSQPDRRFAWTDPRLLQP